MIRFTTMVHISFKPRGPFSLSHSPIRSNPNQIVSNFQTKQIEKFTRLENSSPFQYINERRRRRRKKKLYPLVTLRISDKNGFDLISAIAYFASEKLFKRPKTYLLHTMTATHEIANKMKKQHWINFKMLEKC